MLNDENQRLIILSTMMIDDERKSLRHVREQSQPLYYEVRRGFIENQMHACRMYLQVAAVTEQAERKERNLANAERVRERLDALMSGALLEQPERLRLQHDLAALDEERADLRTDMLVTALSLMYRPAR
jgi:hypothetical protein